MTSTTDELREEVRRRYATAAKAVAVRRAAAAAARSRAAAATTRPTRASGLRSTRSTSESWRPTRRFSRASAAGTRPPSPSSEQGETVLDLGSGGGLDVILSARRVGETGVAYGVDMTDEMLDLARANAAAGGHPQRPFPQG